MFQYTKASEPITDADRRRLQQIFERLIVQGAQEDNLIVIFEILISVTAKEFPEDNCATLTTFVLEMIGEAISRQSNSIWGIPQKRIDWGMMLESEDNTDS